MSDLYYFATYKKNVPKDTRVTATDYDHIFVILRKYAGLTIKSWRYETDSKHKLHLHAIIKFSGGRGPYFKSLCPKGFHSHYTQITGEGAMDKVERYMSKQYSKEQCEAMDIAGYYENHYGFND